MIDAAPAADVVVVTGRGISEDERLAPAVVIDRTAIERSASGRIEDVLRDVAGLAAFRRSDSRSAHPTSQGFTLRGLGGNAASRVSLTLDGVPQADPFGGWVAVTALDPAAMARIRVVRGASGSGEAGAIEIDSAAFEEPDGYGKISVGGDGGVDARGLTGQRWSNGFLFVSSSLTRGDGFIPVVAADRGPADRRAPYRQVNGRVRLVQAIGSSEVQFNLASYGDRRSRGTAFTDNRQRATDASVRLVGHGPLPWSFVAYAQQRRFESEFASVDAERTVATQTLAQTVPARGRGVRAEVAPRWGALAIKAGAEWRRVSGETDEDFRFVAGQPTRQRDAGGASTTTTLFAEAGWSGGGWTAAAEAGANHWHIDRGHLRERSRSDGALLTNLRFAGRSGWQPSGRVGVGRAVGKGVTLRAAAYRNWRLPTLNELYRPFRAGADATAANAALDPERLRGIEAGADWTPSHDSKLSVTVFANRLSDAIANVSLGTGPGTFPGVGFVAAGGVYRVRENVDAIVSRGVEIDGHWARGPWHAAASYAFTDAHLSASSTAAALDGKQPAQTARHSASGSVGWSGGRLAIDATARLAGRQYEDDNNNRRLPAALTFDGVANYGFSRHVAVEARVENLFDRQVIAALAADGTRERALPRTAWLALRVH